MLSIVGLGAVNAGSASAAVATSTQLEAAVLYQINMNRAVAHLPALRSNSRLHNSAYAHNLSMARSNSMSHQLPGETNLAGRLHFYGYTWRAAAENIAWNSSMTVAGAQTMVGMMIREYAPYNGHRLNILNPGSRDVGVSVYLDWAHHKLWLTQDFGTPA